VDIFLIINTVGLNINSQSLINVSPRGTRFKHRIMWNLRRKKRNGDNKGHYGLGTHLHNAQKQILIINKITGVLETVEWKISSFPAIILLIPLLILLIAIYNSPVSAGPYSESAHGNSVNTGYGTGKGVNRAATASAGYGNGNCAHCHEQHASINGSEPAPAGGTPSSYLLFADNYTSQSDNFCYYCHKGVGSVQESFSRTNYNYSYWFGGDTTNHTTPDNIYDTFNPALGSSHNLPDILTFVKTQWPDTFKNESNPCNACHNPHISQRTYPVVRPTDRDNVWGDESGEKMSDYASANGGQYQAPYRYNSTSTYEPDGSVTTDGSNLPDYVTFCSDCHNSSNIIYSTTLGRNLKYIGWSEQNRTYGLAADYHGAVTRCWPVEGMVEATCGVDVDGNPVPRNWGALKEPYLSANKTNYILSCIDCHEPHGAIQGTNSTTPYFLRKTVNSHFNKNAPGPGPWTWDREFCQSCHVHNTHCGGYGGCLTCHYHSAYVRCYACTWCAEGGGGASGHSF